MTVRIMPGASRTRIAIVDDDERLVSALVRDLSAKGLDVCTAPSARQALGLLEERRIDVMLADLRVSSRDGIDLMRAIADVSPSTRSILMSPFATARDYKVAMELGAVEVLGKPFTADELQAALDKAMSQCSVVGSRSDIHRLQLETGADEVTLPGKEVGTMIRTGTEQPTHATVHAGGRTKLLLIAGVVLGAVGVLLLAFGIRRGSDLLDSAPALEAVREISIDVTDWVTPLPKPAPLPASSASAPSAERQDLQQAAAATLQTPPKASAPLRRATGASKRRRRAARRQALSRKTQPRTSADAPPAAALEALPVRRKPVIGTMPGQKPAIGTMGSEQPDIGPMQRETR